MVRTISSSQEEARGQFKNNSNPALPVPWQACSVTDPFPDVYGRPAICLASPLGSGDIKVTLGRERSFPPRGG